MDLYTRNLSLTHRVLACLVVLTLCVSSLPAHALYAQASSSYTFSDCSKVEQTSLRVAIEERAEDALLAGQPDDIAIIVERQWIALNMDAALNGEVERAISAVYEREGYWSRLWSGWSADKAEEYANQIANDAFGSEAFRASIEQLSTAVAGELVADVEARLATASEDAIHCMKDFVGAQYSTTLFTAFEAQVTRDVDDLGFSAAADDVSVSPIDTHSKLLTGVGVILATQIARRVATKLATKITQRIAGKIVTRVVGRIGSSFIPVAGWVIGAILIAWDLWEGGNGALPQIQESLQSEEVKERIRAEITDAIQAGLPDEISAAALEISAALMEEWHGFCRDNLFICTLAEENPRYRAILDATPIDQVPALSSMTELFMDNLGRVELENALENGYFERVAAAPEILLYTDSADETLAWIDLAGEALPQVVALNLYQSSALDIHTLDRETLNAILALDDQKAVAMLLRLEPNEIAAFLDVPMPERRQILAGFPLDDLKWLAGYLGPPQITGNAPSNGTQEQQDETVTALANGDLSMDELQTNWEREQEELRVAETSFINRWLEGWRWNWVLIVLLGVVALILTIIPKVRRPADEKVAPSPPQRPNVRQYELQNDRPSEQYKLHE